MTSTSGLLSASGGRDPSQGRLHALRLEGARRLPATILDGLGASQSKVQSAAQSHLAHLGDRAGPAHAPQGPVHRQPQRQQRCPVGAVCVLATSPHWTRRTGSSSPTSRLEDNLTFDGIVLQVHSVRALSRWRGVSDQAAGSSTTCLRDGLLPRSEARHLVEVMPYFADDSALRAKARAFCEATRTTSCRRCIEGAEGAAGARE